MLEMKDGGALAHADPVFLFTLFLATITNGLNHQKHTICQFLTSFLRS